MTPHLALYRCKLTRCTLHRATRSFPSPLVGEGCRSDAHDIPVAGEGCEP